MRYVASYEQGWTALDLGQQHTVANGTLSVSTAWACSLFAALGDPQSMLYGRNFDWDHSPAVFLYADPLEGYASVSMVDIAFLGITAEEARALTDLPLADRRRLLNAPFLPIDGMNERGLAVGMAAVPDGEMLPDPSRQTVGSLEVIRRMLDQAADVDQALGILQSVNVDMRGGPPVHYLIADASGRAVLAEFYRGELVLIPNHLPWHTATNFLRASVGDSAAGQCWRYDLLEKRLSEAWGQLAPRQAMSLLQEVSRGNTQWSIVYGIGDGQVQVAMGRQYEQLHAFDLPLTDQ